MKTKRIVALVLAVIMMATLVPYTVLAEDTLATEETLSSIHDVLKVGAEGEYSTVYYGGIPWRVLSKNYSSNSEDENAAVGILLLSEHAMANGIRYNAHYSNNAWSSSNYAWASAMVMPWDDPRNPHYESNIANGTKTDDSSGGYLTSDIRMYLTGEGTYETVRAFAYYAESWPASWDTFADRNGQGWRYYTKNLATETEPIDGVTYFVKGEFELSNHGRDCASVNGVTVPGMYALTPADWAEDTWYTLDENGAPVLMTEWPEGATTVNAYYDQAGYSIADVSNGFEEGVKYYTFERYLENTCPNVVVDGQEVAMGQHLASVYKWVAYSIPEMGNSDHNNAILNEVFANGLSASQKNFASDMGFTAAEIAAVLLTSGHGYNRGSGVRYGWSSSIGSTFADRLENDSYFSLSGEEVYLYLTLAGHTKPATFFDGTAAGDIWTRSWGRADIQTVITYANNSVNWYKGANTWWQSIRPAFNLNPDAVFMYTEIADNTYTMTLKDAARNFTLISSDRNGDVLTITYSGANVGANEYISYVLKDKTTGEIVKYVSAAAPITSESGSIDIDISNADTFKYDMYVFNEQVNGELETNYASEMHKVEYSLADYTISLTTDKNSLKATESLTATVSIDRAYYSAEYTFTYDVSKFSCDADTDNDGFIYVTNLYKGQAGDLATYTLVAKNDIQSVSRDNLLIVGGNVIQFKEQVVSDIENLVIGDQESIKIGLNYTSAIVADYVPGYSLVLVFGEDEGYAYNGTKMFYVEAYGAYAVLVEGAVTDEMIEEALTKTTDCETIRQSYDVNAEYVADGKVDLKDATAVYACSVLDFDVVEYMEMYLRADVNGDRVVDMTDINAVTNNYTE